MAITCAEAMSNKIDKLEDELQQYMESLPEIKDILAALITKQDLSISFVLKEDELEGSYKNR